MRTYDPLDGPPPIKLDTLNEHNIFASFHHGRVWALTRDAYGNGNFSFRAIGTSGLTIADGYVGFIAPEGAIRHHVGMGFTVVEFPTDEQFFDWALSRRSGEHLAFTSLDGCAALEPVDPLKSFGPNDACTNRLYAGVDRDGVVWFASARHHLGDYDIRRFTAKSLTAGEPNSMPCLRLQDAVIRLQQKLGVVYEFTSVEEMMEWVQSLKAKKGK